MTRTTRFVPALLVGLLAPALGCSSTGNVNIGNTQNDGGPQLASYMGTWIGHAELWSFGTDGSDRVLLKLDASGNGTIQVGDNTLPPPTDPNVEYPPGVSEASIDVEKVMWEGSPYPTHATRLEAGRLQFGVDTSDLFSGWCALQTPVLQDAFFPGPDAAVGSYGCTPDRIGRSNSPDGGSRCAILAADWSTVVAPIDCGKVFLCSQIAVCSCTESSCAAQNSIPGGTPAVQYPISWDSGLDPQPGSMTATMVYGTVRLTVHLTRQ